MSARGKIPAGIGLLGFTLIVVIAWILISPLFIDEVVEEAFPATEELAAGPVRLAIGQFQDADSIHRGAGNATLFRLANGRHVLRFESFEVTNGPDLYVLVSTHPDPKSRNEVHQGHSDLGALKGNVGSQNYELPDDADALSFRSVVIFCKAFSVIFSVAVLAPP